MEKQDNKPDADEKAHLAQVVQPKKKSSRKLLYTVLVVVAVVFAITMGVVIFKSQQDTDTNKDGGQSISETVKKDPANMTEEEKAAETIEQAVQGLADAVVKESEQTSGAADLEAFRNATAAAQSVVKDINEDELGN